MDNEKERSSVIGWRVTTRTGSREPLPWRRLGATLDQRSPGPNWTAEK